MVALKLNEAWGDLNGQDVLGIGFATPYLSEYPNARRAICAMPGDQGAQIWPEGLKVRSLLVDETALPFVSGLFDRILLVHALEESQDFQKLLQEAARILAPNGRMIIVCVARGGLWAHNDRTPLGFGLPFSRSQLEEAVREAELEPLAWSYALYVPPIRGLLGMAKWFESIVPKIWPLSGGLILMEAGRKPFIAQIRETDRSLLHELQKALNPQPLAPLPMPRSQKPFS